MLPEDIKPREMEPGFLAHMLQKLMNTHGGRNLVAHVRWQAEEIKRLRALVAAQPEPVSVDSLSWAHEDHNGLADAWSSELGGLSIFVERYGGSITWMVGRPGEGAIVRGESLSVDEAQQAATRTADRLRRCLQPKTADVDTTEDPERLRSRLVKLAQDLDKHQESARTVSDTTTDQWRHVRCHGRAQAYKHAAELVRECLSENRRIFSERFSGPPST